MAAEASHVTVSGDTYRNDILGFEITKPRSWSFVASRWAVTLRNRVELDDDEFAEALRLAQVPFVSFLFDHGRPDEPFPTAQATCRPLRTPAALDRAELLRVQLGVLRHAFPDLNVVEATARGIVAGRPANIVKAHFSVRNKQARTFRCRTRSYTIVDRALVFTVGLTGPDGGRFRSDAEFEQITASIRVF